MLFSDLGLAESLLSSLNHQGYTTPTPIQAQAIPPVLAGKDVLGCAQTGTGKTAAFALPILHRLAADTRIIEPRPIRALVLVPTRELANQVVDSFRIYGHNTTLRYTVVFGGVGQNTQVRALRQGVDVLVAAPGRLLDLMNQGFIDLRHVETFVLDEADRMLDMGFIKPIQTVVKHLPVKRQNLMFSATMAPAIRKLADQILKTPVSVAVAPAATTAEKVEQRVYFVERDDKLDLLLRVLAQPEAERVIVFSRTKHGADRLVRHLQRAGGTAQAIHGNKAQRQRERALEAFRDGDTKVLVATDVAARGIDVDGITHVINYDIPNEPESYVHRIGRTGRAGAKGLAISFCDRSERAYLRDIEKLTKQSITVAQEKPFAGQATPALGRVRPQREHREPRQHAIPQHQQRSDEQRSARPESREQRPARSESRDQRPARTEQRDARSARPDSRGGDQRSARPDSRGGEQRSQRPDARGGQRPNGQRPASQGQRPNEQRSARPDHRGAAPKQGASQARPQRTDERRRDHRDGDAPPRRLYTDEGPSSAPSRGRRFGAPRDSRS